MRLLVVTSTGAESDPVADALGAVPARMGRLTSRHAAAGGNTVDLVTSGVGSAAAAATAAVALGEARFDLVISAGIAGGFDPVPVGNIVVASSVVFADLGAETADGVLSIAELGFGADVVDLDATITAELARRTGGVPGAILTVNTVTGTAATASRLRARYPDAAAEAMEGGGVLSAASVCGVAFGEIRAISNRVGPRDRSAWRIADALDALAKAIASVAATPWEIP